VAVGQVRGQACDWAEQQAMSQRGAR